MTMSSNEKEMHDTLNAYVQKGDPNNEIASSLEWARYPLYCNLRSHFQDQSSHISDVEAEYYDGAVHYKTFRNNTVGWRSGGLVVSALAYGGKRSTEGS